MNKEELIIGFFEKGYCCNLDEVKNTCLGLLKENQELKKKLEQYQEEVCILDITTDENIKYKNQQKEFIKYMNDCIKELEKESPNKLQNTVNLGIIDITKTILQKYRNIIGGNKDEK